MRPTVRRLLAMGCNSSKPKPNGEAATTSGHDEKATGKAPSRNGFGSSRAANSDDATSSFGEEEVMAVKRSKPTPSDDALSRAAKDKGVKAEAKPKPKSGFSLGFGSKAKPKVKQPWEDFGNDDESESDLEEQIRRPTKPKAAGKEEVRAPQPPPPPGPPPPHRNPSWLVEDRGPMSLSPSPRTQQMMSFESSKLVDSRALSPTGGGGGAHAVSDILNGNNGYERRYMDGVADAPTPSKRQSKGRGGRRTDEEDEGPAKADPWANLQAKYTLDDVTPPLTPPRAKRLTTATLGESGDVLDVSMEYGMRGVRGRGRPGAAEVTWDGLEPVSNTALDEFAPMEEVADDEVDYRVRANELAMPKVQRRYGGNDTHRSSRRSGSRLDEEEATDEELNDETMPFDPHPDWAARKELYPRQDKPPPPQPQRGIRAPSPPHHHHHHHQHQEEEETLDFGGFGGDNSPPRMAKQGRRAGGGRTKPPMQMAGFGGTQGWDDGGRGFPNQAAGAFASQGGSQAFTLDDDDEDDELDLSSGPIKPTAIQPRRRGPMF